MHNWIASKTLLIVCEGYNEEAFLKYLSPRLAPRGCGLKVTIKNARGKSAKHIVGVAKSQSASFAYDTVAVMLDTDTDWSESIAATAKSNKIIAITSEPCFEALMLRVIGKPATGDASSLKKTFAIYVKNDACVSQNYAANFGIEILVATQNKEHAIKELLALFAKR